MKHPYYFFTPLASAICCILSQHSYAQPQQLETLVLSAAPHNSTQLDPFNPDLLTTPHNIRYLDQDDLQEIGRAHV